MLLKHHSASRSHLTALSTPTKKRQLVGAVETGGTKFRAAVVDADMSVIESIVIPTTTPPETLARVGDFFSSCDPIEALGIAAFGPLDLDRGSPGYGSVTSTPKEGWSNTGVLRELSQALGVPADIQTDVEAAAVAEQLLGAEPRPRCLAYVTVGTGIGAAVSIDGSPVRGCRHSELGHIPVQRVPGDTYPGGCPFHSDCLEGMASGPAIAERLGVDPSTVDDDDGVWRLVARYLAQLVRVLVYGFAPDRIIFGGGVGARESMCSLIHNLSKRELAGYSDYLSDSPDIISAPVLGDDSGLLGAALLAHSLPNEQSK